MKRSISTPARPWAPSARARSLTFYNPQRPHRALDGGSHRPRIRPNWRPDLLFSKCLLDGEAYTPLFEVWLQREDWVVNYQKGPGSNEGLDRSACNAVG